jgi:hypothetical protein
MVHTITQNIHTIIQTHSLATLTHKKTQSDTNTQTNRYIQTQMHPQTQTDTDSETHTNKQTDRHTCTFIHWSSNSFLRLITHKHRLFHPITTHAIRFICFLINVTHFKGTFFHGRIGSFVLEIRS